MHHKSNQEDMDKNDIIAAIRKTGTTLAALSRKYGLSSSTLPNTLIRPWVKGEVIIAHRLGKQPEEIWPSRYQKQRKKVTISSIKTVCE